MDKKSSSGPPRVAYIWSQELQDVSDQLPANIGRSSMVHGLIRALNYLEEGNNDDHDGHDGHDVYQTKDTTNETNDANGQPIDVDVELEETEMTSSNEQEIEWMNRIKTDDNVYRRARVVQPDLLLGTTESLRRYHDARYVEYLLKSRETGSEDGESDVSSSSSSCSNRPVKRRRTEYHGLEYDCPRFPALSQYASFLAASTSTACRFLARGSADITINWDGGRHHAMRNRASGFCYVADIVLGIMHLTKHGRGRNGKRPRVLYLDLDLHYGDGVAQAFLSPTQYPVEVTERKTPPRPPQVLTLSVHHHSPVFFSSHSAHSSLPDQNTPHPFTLSLPLAAYASPDTYAKVWGNVENVRQAFDPDYVVVQLGVDGLEGDRVGQYGAWGIDGQGGIRWCIEKIKSWNIPCCVLGGGGYDHANAARAWAVATSVLLDRNLSLQTSIPDHSFFPSYRPSFTFDDSPSQVRDENTEEQLDTIEATFKHLASRIRDILTAHS